MRSCKSFLLCICQSSGSSMWKKNYYHFYSIFCWCFVCKWWRGGGIKRHEYEKGFSSIYSDQEGAAVDQSIFIVMWMHCSEVRRDFNPFLFIWGLSCPRYVQTLIISKLSQAKYCIPRFLYNLLLVQYIMVTLALEKHISSIGLEIGPNNAFIAFRTPLPSASYSAGQVWLPPGRL